MFLRNGSIYLPVYTSSKPEEHNHFCCWLTVATL